MNIYTHIWFQIAKKGSQSIPQESGFTTYAEVRQKLYTIDIQKSSVTEHNDFLKQFYE